MNNIKKLDCTILSELKDKKLVDIHTRFLKDGIETTFIFDNGAAISTNNYTYVGYINNANNTKEDSVNTSLSNANIFANAFANIFDGKTGEFLYSNSLVSLAILKEIFAGNAVELYNDDNTPVSNFDGGLYKTDSDGFVSLKREKDGFNKQKNI